MAIHRFAYIKDGVIFNISNFPDDASVHPSGPRLVAGMQSNPYLVYIPEDQWKNVFISSTWDGQNFHDPA
jgi:hypothetical protein